MRVVSTEIFQCRSFTNGKPIFSRSHLCLTSQNKRISLRWLRTASSISWNSMRNDCVSLCCATEWRARDQISTHGCSWSEVRPFASFSHWLWLIGQWQCRYRPKVFIYSLHWFVEIIARKTRRSCNCKSVWFHSRFFSVPTAENKTPFDNMAQRLTYRRRLSYNTRSNRVKVYVRRHYSSGVVRIRFSFQCQNTRWQTHLSIHEKTRHCPEMWWHQSRITRRTFTVLSLGHRLCSLNGDI